MSTETIDRASESLKLSVGEEAINVTKNMRKRTYSCTEMKPYNITTKKFIGLVIIICRHILFITRQNILRMTLVSEIIYTCITRFNSAVKFDTKFV